MHLKDLRLLVLPLCVLAASPGLAQPAGTSAIPPLPSNRAGLPPLDSKALEAMKPAMGPVPTPATKPTRSGTETQQKASGATSPVSMLKACRVDFRPRSTSLSAPASGAELKIVFSGDKDCLTAASADVLWAEASLRSFTQEVVVRAEPNTSYEERVSRIFVVAGLAQLEFELRQSGATRPAPAVDAPVEPHDSLAAIRNPAIPPEVSVSSETSAATEPAVPVHIDTPPHTKELAAAEHQAPLDAADMVASPVQDANQPLAPAAPAVEGTGIRINAQIQPSHPLSEPVAAFAREDDVMVVLPSTGEGPVDHGIAAPAAQVKSPADIELATSVKAIELGALKSPETSTPIKATAETPAGYDEIDLQGVEE